MTVGLVLVAHSAKLAEGVRELAAQMAPDVPISAVGGLAGRGIGTDFDAVHAAARAGLDGGVVLLYDLGSARMTADMVVEVLDAPDSVVMVDAPLVEGAVAAAVAAQGGGALIEVAAAARAAAGELGQQPKPVRPGKPGEPGAPEPAGPLVEQDVVLRNEVGLHARPAALLARAIVELDAEVLINYAGADADARSVLALMSLGARGGEVVAVSASGPDAAEAVRRIAELAECGLGD